MEVPLYRKKVVVGYAKVSKEDYSRVMKQRWRIHPRGYAISTTTNDLMHRIIIDCPDHLYVDHNNHDKLDNRRENLSAVTPKMNMANRRINRNNKTGVKGVHHFRNKYRVFVGANYIGVYKTIQEAKEAYEKAFRKHFSVSVDTFDV